MREFYVYLIINRINSKKYVGWCVDSLEKRWKGHLKAARKTEAMRYKVALSRAILKYGKENFSISVLARPTSEEEAKTLEKDFIRKLGSHVALGNGYNETLGGDGSTGFRHSQEARQEISQAARNPSEETRSLKSASVRERYRDPDYAERRRISSMKNRQTIYGRANTLTPHLLRAYQKGRHEEFLAERPLELRVLLEQRLRDFILGYPDINWSLTNAQIERQLGISNVSRMRARHEEVRRETLHSNQRPGEQAEHLGISTPGDAEVGNPSGSD